MAKAKVNYREGDWFAVPLQDGGYGVGIVARADLKGVTLGYFFGPKREAVPSLEEVAQLRPVDAVLVGMFGDLGLIRNEWPVIGSVEGWDRNEWPMPVFVRYEELTGRTFHVFYDPDHPNRVIREEQVPPGEAEQGPQDGLMGFGYTEAVLTRLLA